jgi:hypothetical protein
MRAREARLDRARLGRTSPINVGDTGTFLSVYQQHEERDGQEFTVVRVIKKADKDHDAEVLPMYEVLFRDGTRIEAWPEEVEP